MSSTTDQTFLRSEPGAGPNGMLPLSVPHLAGNEWQYVKECLDTNFVSSVGPYVNRFEAEVAAYVGAREGVAVTTGTAALHTALLVLGVEPDDEVLMPALTFVAPANAIRYVNAWPVFIDVEPEYWQLDVQKVADFLARQCHVIDGELRNRRTTRRIRAILPVHILGHPCDLDPLIELARRYDLRVVEDATESLGARYRGAHPGTRGDIGCYSFNGNKVITTGGGGMLVTNNESWARRARYLTTQAKDDPIEYVHEAIGYNYRLTNVQAAIGCAQLEQLDGFVAARRANWRRYREGLGGVRGVTVMREAPNVMSSCWLSTILVDERAYGMDSRALMTHLHGAGIQSRPLWHPLHRLRPYAGCEAYRIEHAEHLTRDALSLPSSVTLSEGDVDRVTREIAAAAR